MTGILPTKTPFIGLSSGLVADGATVPDGAITLPEAVESQLGLRLRMGKRPLTSTYPPIGSNAGSQPT
jgi:hypothetical protein